PAARRPGTVLALEALEDRNLLSGGPTDPGTQALQQIDHFVVIYQENWSFDSLYPRFPGANGIGSASQTSLVQVDKSGNPLASFPPVLGPDGNPDPRFPSPPPQGPYDAVPFLIKNAPPGDPAGLTGDMIHR